MFSTLKHFFDFCSVVNRKRFYLSLVLGIGIALCEGMKFPAVYLVLKGFFDKTPSLEHVLFGTSILIIASIIEILLRSKSSMLQTIAGYGECAQKRIDIAEHLRYLPMGYFNTNSLGKIVSVTTNTMENLGDVATRVVMLSSQGILNTAMLLIFLCIFDLRIGLIALIGTGLFAFVNHLMQKKNKDISDEKIKNDTRLVSEVLEYVKGIAEVKAYQITGSARTKLNSTIDSVSDTDSALELAANTYIPIQTIISKLTSVCICLASVYFYLSGTMVLLYTIVFIIFSFFIFTGLESLGSYSALLRIVERSVDKAEDILSLETMDINGVDKEPSDHTSSLDNIDFAYAQRKIIDGVTLQIPKRSSAAFVGPSGSGKSTLCKLIARFWDVNTGAVYLGDTNVKDYSMNSLMNNFSFVFQNVFLFNDTIANNIKFAKPDATLEEIEQVAKLACCHDFTIKLPKGYDTVIGEDGTSLSGGERQRISIARAIMKDAPIIILDEATANVDPENEKDLMDAIDALTKEKTVIMIAHRLKTVQNADQIFVIDKGQILQRGTHEELIAQEGIYKNFIDKRKEAVSWKIV